MASGEALVMLHWVIVLSRLLAKGDKGMK